MKNIVEKLKEYLESKGIPVSVAEKEIGVSNGTLQKPFNAGTTIKTDTLEKFLFFYDDLKPNWLLNKEFEENSFVKRNLIPLYNDVATIGGNTGMSATLDAVSHTTEYIDAGDWFPGATDAIRHYGSSMVEYPSGAILALKRVEDMRLIFWGRTYCIETTEGRLTKRLNKSKNKDILMAYSSNNDTYPDGCLIHEPIEIPTETIHRVFQVLGCVTKEYSNGTVEIINKNN